MTIPANARHSKNRVRVKNTHIALVGGRFAFADFHVTPPLGRSMTTKPPWPHHQLEIFYQFDRWREMRGGGRFVQEMWKLDRKLLPLMFEGGWIEDEMREIQGLCWGHI
jgi:hypothetical protein